MDALHSTTGELLASIANGIAGITAGTAGTLSPKGNALVTVTSTAQTLTQLLVAAAGTILAIPVGSLGVEIQPEGGDIRMTTGGQTPTSTTPGVGTKVSNLVTWPVTGAAAIAAVQLIAPVNTPCNLAFYG